MSAVSTNPASREWTPWRDLLPGVRAAVIAAGYSQRHADALEWRLVPIGREGPHAACDLESRP